MGFKELIRHQFIGFFRSKVWKASLGLRIFTLFGFLVVSLELIAAGWFADFIITQLKTGKSVRDVFSSYLLFYFMMEFISRFFMQDIPVLKIQPYLLLNIPRKNLIHFLLGKSLFSYFNLFFLTVAIPFGIKNILLDGQLLEFIWWMLTIIFAVFSVNFLALLVKITFGNNLTSTLTALVIIGSTALVHLYQWVDFKAVSMLIFNSGPGSVLLFASMLITSYSINYRLKKRDIYFNQKSKNALKWTFIDNLLNGLKSNSIVSELIILELKLIFRNKVPRTIIISSLVFILLGLIFQFLPFMPTNLKIQFMIMGIVGMANGYGGGLPSWESTFYDGLMTRNIDLKTYLNAKYKMFFILAMAGLIPSLFILLIDVDLFIGGLCAILYVAGLNSIAFIGLSNKNFMRVDIHEPSGFNKNANLGSVFGWKILLSIIPVLIYLPFILLKWYLYGAYFLGFLGLLGFLLHRQFIKEFVEKYKQNKYFMLEGFRTK